MALRDYSISTFAMIKHPLKSSLEQLVQAGWTSIEIMCEDGHRELLHWSDEELAWLKSFGETHGIRWSLHAPVHGCNPCTQDAQLKAEALQLLQQSFRIAEKLNCSYVVMHVGGIDGSLSGDEATQYEQGMQQTVEFLAEFLKTVSASQVQLALENVPPYPGLVGSKMETIIRIIEQVGSPQLKVLFDAGHAHMRGNGECVHALNVCIKHLISMHLNDNHGTKDEHAAIGTGTVPMQQVVEILEAYGYQGNWVLETETPELAEISAGVLDDLRSDVN